MLKELLEEKNISIYRLAKDINEPYSTINDIVNGKVDIEDCKVKILKKISDYLELTMEEVFSKCKISHEIYSVDYAVYGNLEVKHKKYYLDFSYDKEDYKIELCKVTELSSMFILEVAKYEMEKEITQKRLETYICSMQS